MATTVTVAGELRALRPSTETWTLTEPADPTSKEISKVAGEAAFMLTDGTLVATAEEPDTTTVMTAASLGTRPVAGFPKLSLARAVHFTCEFSKDDAGQETGDLVMSGPAPVT
jgi:hypothetical protein